MIEKQASANWKGTLKEGAGTLSTQSGSLQNTPYTFATRFEGKKGANPEELIGAAHSGCYAMFLSALMSGEDITPEDISATSTISLDPETEGSPTVTKAHLDVTVKAPAPADKIKELAEAAKSACPISKLLNAEISLNLTVA